MASKKVYVLSWNGQQIGLSESLERLIKYANDCRMYDVYNGYKASGNKYTITEENKEDLILYAI